MKAKQIRTTACLTVLLTVGTQLILASCGNTPAQDVPGSQTTAAAAAPETEAEEEKEQPYTESKDYGGMNFNMLICNSDEYYYSNEETGDVLNDAVYHRTINTEGWLNIKINSTPMFVNVSTEFSDAVQKLVLAGDDTYHLIVGHCIRGISDFVANGYLYDWNDIPTLHLDRDYWNQSCNKALSIGGHQYVAKSDFILSDPACMLFGKALVSELDLEDPYMIVRSGKWTLDKMFEMGTAATKDLNGDGKYTIDDQFGFTGMGNYPFNSFIHSSGIALASKDADDSFTMSVMNDRMISLVEKFDGYINGTNNTFIWPYQSPEENTLKVSSGRVLFQAEVVSALNKYRDSDVDFGILPYPKLDESQNGYTVNDWSSLMYIPNTAKDIDMAGDVLEVMTYYSQKLTVPAYYDVQLGTKLARDTDTREMLDMIWAGVVYDAGVNYFGFGQNMMDLFYTIPNLVITGKKGDFSSWYAKKEKGAAKEISKFNDAMAQ